MDSLLRARCFAQRKSICDWQMLFIMYVTRFELATFWSVARRSIQLSYTYIPADFSTASMIIVAWVVFVNWKFQKTDIIFWQGCSTDRHDIHGDC